MKHRRLLRADQKRRRGLSLVEVMFGMILASLLMGGTMDLFMNAARSTLKVNAQTSASQDASNAVQQIILTTREAWAFALPNEQAPNGSWASVTGFSDSSLSNTYNGENINTGIEIFQAGTQTVSVQNSANQTIAVSPPPLYRDGPATTTLLIYRGDSNQSADSTAGTYLWEYNVQANTYLALCKSVDPNTPNAVQFVRPVVLIGQSQQQATPQPYDLEVKIVSSYYSLVNGRQTSEESNGSDTSQISGKCVLMRDYGNTVVPTTNGNTNNNAFQAH